MPSSVRATVTEHRAPTLRDVSDLLTGAGAPSLLTTQVFASLLGAQAAADAAYATDDSARTTAAGVGPSAAASASSSASSSVSSATGTAHSTASPEVVRARTAALAVYAKAAGGFASTAHAPTKLFVA